MDPKYSVTVVIRSSRERTEELCRQLILSEGIPEEHLFTIHERPFSKAMKTSYQIGIDGGRPWTFIVDADVLLKPGSVGEMLQAAQDSSDEVLVLSGKLLDKFFGDIRRAGNHLFRTSLLHRVLDSVAGYEEEGVRPESSVIDSLHEEGLVWQKLEMKIGLHDFEQHYHDIARKAFVHAHKHREFIGELADFWTGRSDEDDDFRAALFGLSKGLVHNGSVKINVEEFEALYEEVINAFGTKTDDLSGFRLKRPADVEDAMNDDRHYHRPSDGLKKRYDEIVGMEIKNQSYGTLFRSIWKKFKRNLKGRSHSY